MILRRPSLGAAPWLMAGLAATCLLTLADTKKSPTPPPPKKAETGKGASKAGAPPTGKAANAPASPAPARSETGAARAATNGVGAPGIDILMKAMRDEMERIRLLSLAGDPPYYVEYAIDDVHSSRVSASLGSLLTSSTTRVRLPRVRVRVGDYKQDNTNYIFSDFFGGSKYDPNQLPLDDNYNALRHGFWLATDRLYKGAVEALARKRAALNAVNQPQDLPDFHRSQPAQVMAPARLENIDLQAWQPKVKELSAIFRNYPGIQFSQVDFDAAQSVRRFIDTEGTQARVPDSVFYWTVRALSQAPDGMTLRNQMVLPMLELGHLPSQQALATEIRTLAEQLEALRKAPVGESYSGPMLFEGTASAQLFAEVLAPNLALPRKPVSEPGRTPPFAASEFEGRIDSRVLPDFLDVVDDPLRGQFNGAPLTGGYAIDEEGVAPKPVTLVDKGRLKGYLLTRLPVKGGDASNGRARFPGPYGTKLAAASNLFIQVNEGGVAAAELKTKLIDMIKQRGKPYGIIVRKTDFPTSASFEELRRIATSAQSAGSARPVSLPLLVYRVYPDGREELVRGQRFRGLTVRSLRDILAVSRESYVFHYLNNMRPFAVIGAGGVVAPTSVVAPAILFEDLELDVPQDDRPKLPVVPAPALSDGTARNAAAEATLAAGLH